MIAPVVTRRYAEALLDAATVARQVTEVEADLMVVAESLQNDEVLALIFNPTVETSVLRARFLDPIAPRLKTRLVRNILGLLIDRRRAGVIPNLPGVFHQIALAARGEAEGFVESAAALRPDELAATERWLSEATGKRVKLATRIVPDLLGGFRVTVGSRRYDASLKSKLSALRERMLGASID
jgi:F-type H+-transporting ATPase subunit delta